jgi:hypothetical protein
MATIKCPSCGRLLNLPNSLRGTEVQCPSCHNNFVPPRDDEPLAIPLAAPVMRPVPVPAQGAAAEAAAAFDFDDAEQARHNRVRRKVDAAATWLRRAVVCDFLPSLLCCPIFAEAPAHVFVARDLWVFALVGGGLLIMSPSILILIGSYYLTKRRVYGLVMTTAIMAFLLAIKDMALMSLVTVFVLRVFPRDGCISLFSLVTFILAAAAMINAVGGGIKTLNALNDREVRMDFR